MIGHGIEIWVSLAAAFAVGSVFGWLLYRWIDRSDYAYDQRELTGALTRTDEYEAELEAEFEPVRTYREPLRETYLLEAPKPSPAAETLRQKVMSSSRAAAWRDSRLVDEDIEASELEDDDPFDLETIDWASLGRGEEETAGDEPWSATSGAWPPADRAVPASGRALASLPPPARPAGPIQVTLLPPPVDAVWANDDHEPSPEPDAFDEWEEPAEPDDQEVETAATLLINIPSEDETDRPPALSRRPSDADNLRKLRGVGPAFAERLHQLGIYRYEQIASWTSKQQHWIGEALGAVARVERYDWRSQAARLLRKASAATETADD